jgi:cell wall assembly regulator SMI1
MDVYTHASWIPMFKDGWRADYLGLDLEPLAAGTVGQVINFGRDEDAHFAAFSDLSAFLGFWLDEARAGRCRLLPAEKGAPEWLEHVDGNSIDVLRARCGHASRNR